MFDEAEWLEKLAAHPEDSALRRVFADALMREGDPRGELIALSMAIATGDRQHDIIDQAKALEVAATRCWETSLGVASGELRLEHGMPAALSVGPDRARVLWGSIAMRLAGHLTIDTDDPTEMLTDSIRELGWPAELRSIAFKCEADLMFEDAGETIERQLVPDGVAIDIEMGATEPRSVFTTALHALLATRPVLASVTLRLVAANRYDIDPVLDIIERSGPWPALTKLCITQWWSLNGDEPYVWIRSENLGRLLAQLPALESLQLPAASLTLDRLSHPRLRELTLFWYDGHNGRPRTPFTRDVAPPPRASGLTFFARSNLPRLEHLVIDLTYDWYVTWEPADFAALAAANLPSLRSLVLCCIPEQPELVPQLVHAAWLETLETLEIRESDLEPSTIDALIAMRPQLAHLRKLEVDTRVDSQIARLREAFPDVYER